MKHAFLTLLSLLAIVACVGEKPGVPLGEVSRMEGRNGYQIAPSTSDWTPYKALRWTVSNDSDLPLFLWVRLQEPEVSASYALGVSPVRGCLTGLYSTEIDYSRIGSL